MLAPVASLGRRAGGATTRSLAAEPVSAQAALRELRSFRVFGSVLYVAAHPDDENTQLIAYLARGRDYRTAYLSLTRGDGGQNVIGPEFGDLLGVIRTQELLAAGRSTGAASSSPAPATSAIRRITDRPSRSGTTSRCFPMLCG